MSISVDVAFGLTVSATLSGLANADTSGKVATALFNALNIARQKQSATSSPPCLAVASERLVLAAGGAGGSGQIDFTSIAGVDASGNIGSAVNMTGLKLQYFLLMGGSSNAHDVLVLSGSSNGYDISGTSGCKIPVSPIASVGFAGSNNAVVIDGTHKILDVIGVAGDVLLLIAVFG